MPTFKHPCPYCGRFIDGASVACPFCGVTEPFTRGRCPDCRAVLQPGWIACPKCGRTLTSADTITPAAIGTTGAEMAAGAPNPVQPSAPGTPAGLSPDPAAVPAPPAAVPAPPPAVAGTCSGCAAPLAVGARFCQQCGTLAG